MNKRNADVNVHINLNVNMNICDVHKYACTDVTSRLNAILPIAAFGRLGLKNYCQGIQVSSVVISFNHQ